jgi:hypothetical protein
LKPNQKATPAGDPQGVPTILVVGNDDRLAVLAESLQADGYLVLRASDCDDAVRVATVHSRVIHVLLMYDSPSASNLPEILKPFRLDEMLVLKVTGPPRGALAEVRQLVKPPIASPPPRQKGQAA